MYCANSVHVLIHKPYELGLYEVGGDISTLKKTKQISMNS